MNTQIIHNATFTDTTTDFYLVRRSDNYVETRDVINGKETYNIYDVTRIHDNKDILPQDTKGKGEGDPQLKLKDNSLNKKYKSLRIIMAMQPGIVYSWNQLPKSANSKDNLPAETNVVDVKVELKKLAIKKRNDIEAAAKLIGVELTEDQIKAKVKEAIIERRNELKTEIEDVLAKNLAALEAAHTKAKELLTTNAEEAIASIPTDEELDKLEEDAE